MRRRPQPRFPSGHTWRRCAWIRQTASSVRSRNACRGCGYQPRRWPEHGRWFGSPVGRLWTSRTELGTTGSSAPAPTEQSQSPPVSPQRRPRPGAGAGCAPPAGRLPIGRAERRLGCCLTTILVGRRQPKAVTEWLHRAVTLLGSQDVDFGLRPGYPSERSRPRFAERPLASGRAGWCSVRHCASEVFPSSTGESLWTLWITLDRVRVRMKRFRPAGRAT